MGKKNPPPHIPFIPESVLVPSCISSNSYFNDSAE